MKRLILLFILSFGVNAFAAERCTLHKKVVSQHHDYIGVLTTTVTPKYKAKLTRSWEECFQYAVLEARKLDMTRGPYSSVHSIRYEDGDVRDTRIQFDIGYLFIQWYYDDGIIVDTNGMVNKYTDIGMPIDDDARAISSGELLVR